MRMPAHPRFARGFAMIEVLVTLIIVLVGLLGAAGVLVVGHRSSVEAYQRTQALILLEDMVDRLSANRQVADCYAVTDASTGAPQLGHGIHRDPVLRLRDARAAGDGNR